MKTTWASIIARPFWVFTGWMLRTPERIEERRARKAREAFDEGYREGWREVVERYERTIRDKDRIIDAQAARLRQPADVRAQYLPSQERVGFTMSRETFEQMQGAPRSSLSGFAEALMGSMGGAGGAVGNAFGIFGGGGGPGIPPRGSHEQYRALSGLMDKLMGD